MKHSLHSVAEKVVPWLAAALLVGALFYGLIVLFIWAVSESLINLLGLIL